MRARARTQTGVSVPDCSRVLGYVRVSTQEQSESGLGLAAQEAAVRAECERRGWTLVGVYTDAGVSGSVPDRPGLGAVLAALEAGEADTLMVSKVDRLSRSLGHFAEVMEVSRRQAWSVVALDLGVDTSTPAGEMLANVLATFAHYERRLIGQRTKDALAEKRAQGVKLGRPRSVPDSVRAHIRALRESGMTWQAVADTLQAQEVPTGQGGAKWYANTVRRIALAAHASSLEAAGA